MTLLKWLVNKFGPHQAAAIVSIIVALISLLMFSLIASMTGHITGIGMLFSCLIPLLIVPLFTSSQFKLLAMLERSKVALEESNRRYRDILEAIDDGYFEINLAGELIFLNSPMCRILDRPHGELLGSSYTRYLDQLELDQLSRYFSATASNPPGLEQIWCISRPDQHDVHIEALITASRDEQDHLTGFRAVARDITEKKNAEQERTKLQAQFQHSQKMEALGTLAGGIAHDFNNILMGIQGNASLVLMDLDPPHPHHESLTDMVKLVNSGAKLTRQLLGYARKGKYEVQLCNLNEIIRSAAETFGRTKKEITIHYDLCSDAPSIEADEAQIHLALLNIFVNAGEAMLEGGTLSLRTVSMEQPEVQLPGGSPGAAVPLHVKVVITDTGPGIPPEVMKRIFEPFFTTKEMGRGTGLGLASAYGIIEGHGGRITVDSSPRSGATFSIHLPAVKRAAATSKTDLPELRYVDRTVILIDDEPLILKACASLLRSLGFTVVPCGGGQEALDYLQEPGSASGVDLIILDMIMPGMNGLETYERLREVLPEGKVLLSSGYSINDQAAEILNRGCDGFIQKPFGRKALLSKLKELL